MSTLCRRLDEVALWNILKLVDASTLQKCRRVSRKWNEEVLRLNKYTKKFNPTELIVEIEGTGFKISVGTPNNSKCFKEDPVNSETIKRVFRHVDPPETLMIFLNWSAGFNEFDELMKGFKEEWFCKVQEMEIVIHNSDLQLSKVLSHLKKFRNLTSLSLSHYCNERISMGDIFEMLPELRKLRVFGFNSNDGSECSSGLVFDDNAVEKLLRNQKNFRKIENLELFNTDLTVSLESMTEVLRTLGRLSVDPRILQNSSMSEESLSVNLLFENCHWDSLKELNLLSTIISISSYFSFPILQPNENVLKGDFRFSIYDTNFILKFMI